MSRVLRDEFGWSKAALSGAFSMQQIENGMLGPVQGWLIDRFGPRLSMRIGVLMFGFGFIAFSQIQLAHRLLPRLPVMAIGTSLGGYFPFTVVLVNWFEKRRARALASFQMGGAAGGLLVVVVAPCRWSTSAGARRPWSRASSSGDRTTAGSDRAHAAPGHGTASRRRGRAPEHGSAGANGATPSAVDGFTLKQAMRTSAFWFISFGHGSALLIVAAVQVHLVLHLEDDLGYSLALAATAVAVIQASQMAGTFLGSLIGDKYDKRYISMWCMLSHSVGMLLFAVAQNELMVFTAAILHGVAWGLARPDDGGPERRLLRPGRIWRDPGHVFVDHDVRVYRRARWLPGYLADQTGSYEEGFILLAVLSGMGSVFFWLSKRPAPPQPEPVLVEREA